jgi:hypothetical protein
MRIMKDEVEKDNAGGPKEITEEADSVTARNNILTLMDSFVDRIFQIRRTLVGVSISALILAPIAIGLSIYLIRHPSFFVVIESENEFEILLSTLLGTVIIISCIWLFAGTRQYIRIGSWNKQYKKFVAEKELRDQSIASHFGL